MPAADDACVKRSELSIEHRLRKSFPHGPAPPNARAVSSESFARVSAPSGESRLAATQRSVRAAISAAKRES